MILSSASPPDLTGPTPAPRAGARVIARLADLRHRGELGPAEAAAAEAQLIATSHGAEKAPDHIRLSLLVDAQGMVKDARFQSAASGALLAAYDLMVERLIGRPLAEAQGVTPRRIDAELRDDPAQPVLELGADADQPFYVLVKALERHAGAHASADAATAAPAAAPALAEPARPADPHAALPWDEAGLFEKVRRIEAVLDAQVRPALASDGGGIDLVDLQGSDLFVQYHGACGSCSSSIGGTLHFIQDSLNNHLGTALTIKVSGIEESAFGL